MVSVGSVARVFPERGNMAVELVYSVTLTKFELEDRFNS